MNGELCAADCDRLALPRGYYCDTHQQRLRRNGTLELQDKWRAMSVEERFWAHVQKGEPGDCWEWTSERTKAGYGVFYTRSGGRRVKNYAHRYSMRLAGHDLGDLFVLHGCDNPPCVNPAHLSLGTQADNIRDAQRKNRMNTSGLVAGWEKQRAKPVRYCPCGEPVSARDLCKPHYMMWWRERRRLSR